MTESLFVYFFLFVIMFGCGYIASRRGGRRYVGGSGVYRETSIFRMPELFLLFFAFALVFGCRWGVGRDYFRYLDAYTFDVPERYEFLFRSISVFLQQIGAHYSVFFGVWALLDITLLYYACRRFKFIYPYLAFFLIFGSYYLPMMNAIRQHLAGLIFMCSIQFVEQKKPIQFGICFCLSLLFHKLAIVLFLFYPLLRWKDDWFKSIPIQLVLYGIAVFLSLHGDMIIRWIEYPFEWATDAFGFERYNYNFLTQEKFDRTKFGSNTGLGLVVNIIRTIPIILLSKRFKQYFNSSYFNMFYTLSFIYILSSLMFGDSVILNRFSYFFSCFHLVIISLFTYYCFQKKDTLHLLLGLMIILMYIPLFLNMLRNPQSTAQYMFFWEPAMLEYN